MDIDEITKLRTLHDRASATVDTLLNRALHSLSGVERTIVGQAAQLIYPRVQRKLRSVTDAQLQEELAYFRSLIDAILQDQRPNTRPKKRATKRANRGRAAAADKRR